MTPNEFIIWLNGYFNGIGDPIKLNDKELRDIIKNIDFKLTSVNGIEESAQSVILKILDNHQNKKLLLG